MSSSDSDARSDSEDEGHKNIPLKKRKAQQRLSSSDSEGEEFVDEYDDELYKDDEDRRRLAGLSEMEREQILNERYEKRKAAQERLDLKRKLKAKRRGEQAHKAERQTRTRISAAHSRKATLSQYTAKRKEKAREAKKKKREVRSSSSEDEGESRGQVTEQRIVETTEQPQEEGEIAEKGERPTLEQCNSIRLSRNTLEKWVDEPFFERLVVGFFVRIGIGMNKEGRMVYRLVQIQAVTEGARAYRLGKKETFKHLIVKHADTEKPFRMEFVSNQDITATELDKWISSMEKAKLPIITPQEILAKREALSIADNYVYTNEDIEKMVQEKKKLKSKPLSISKQKAQLIAQKQAAKDEGNLEKEMEIKHELRALKELESEENARMLNWHKASKVSLADINKRNKASNMVKVVEKKSQAESSETDPFSRRPTKPSIVSVVTTKQPLAPAEERTGKDENGNEKEKEKEVGEREVVASEPVGDTVLKAHDEVQLDIDIDLTSGQRVPLSLPKSETTGDNKKRPAPPPSQKKTLSVLDYKRRRGLI